jgi:hypothetical protein
LATTDMHVIICTFAVLRHAAINDEWQ